MRYYPLSRVITGSKASGNDFTLNGVPYIGPYYKTFDGNFFTGNDPVTGKSEVLVSTTAARRNEFIDMQEDTQLQSLNGDVFNLNSFAVINPYYPNPTQMDYERGFIFRYFAKKRNENGNLIETTKAVHNSLQYAGSPYNYELYHSIQLYWQLTGPLHDTVNTTNGVRTAGIEDTNKRLVELKDKEFRGLRTFIGGKYLKFAKPVA